MFSVLGSPALLQRKANLETGDQPLWELLTSDDTTLIRGGPCTVAVATKQGQVISLASLASCRQ